MENTSPEAPATEPSTRQFIGVKFRNASTIHHYEANPSMQLHTGDLVIVNTEQGNRLGVVTELPMALRGEKAAGVRQVVRKADAGDLDRSDRLHSKEREAIRQCLICIRERNLEMKLIKAEQLQSGGKIVIYFSAEGRIDFRELVRDLARLLHARIEMRQVNSREEAKILGAAGPCGRELCCSTWLRTPGGVSVKMAKAQGLSLIPTKLTGMCGRLKCCLRYEYDTYLELGRSLPNAGTRVTSLQGEGVVIRQNPMTQTVLVQLDADGVIIDAARDDLVVKKKS